MPHGHHPAPRFCRRSKAQARVVPVALGSIPPKPKRAARAGFGDRAGQTAEVLTRKHRLLLVRTDADLEAAAAIGISRLLAVTHVALDARGLAPEQAARLAAGAVLRCWRYARLRTRPDPDQPVLDRLDVLVDDPKTARVVWAAMAPGIAGTLLARDLVAEPSNTLTPAALATRLGELRRHGVAVEILEPDRLAAEGLHGLLAVGGASAHPPRLAVLRWPGTAPAAPVLLVGKGITFDTGGVCIKPAQGMWEMRADMAGAAACAGAILALALRRSACPAVAVLPLAENAVGASSYRPGDVLRLHGGTTVEVVDTDAEGRLVLADALSWSIKTFRPQLAIDLATLTGSIITALGHDRAGLFSASDVLAADLASAGAAVSERTWRMPLSAAYAEALESDVADIRHCSEGSLQPDACHAAQFLRTFVGDTPWVHLDIAGVESNEKPSDRHPAGPTGWGARLLDRLIQDRFGSGWNAGTNP